MAVSEKAKASMILHDNAELDGTNKQQKIQKPKPQQWKATHRTPTNENSASNLEKGVKKVAQYEKSKKKKRSNGHGARAQNHTGSRPNDRKMRKRKKQTTELQLPVTSKPVTRSRQEDRLVEQRRGGGGQRLLSATIGKTREMSV